MFESHSGNIIRYEESTGIWVKMRSMNRARMEFPMVTCGGKIYSICGNTSDYSNVAQVF